MKRGFGPLLILLAAVIVFGPTIRHDFTDYDDPQTIVGNADFTPPTLSSLVHLWSTPQAGLYVPVSYSLWWLTAQMGFRDGQMHASIFHGLSLGLHVVCGLLIWRNLRVLQCGPAAATVGALIFVLHPAQVETVAWASGAKDQLATLFSLLAISAYLRPDALSLFPCTQGERGRGRGAEFAEASKLSTPVVPEAPLSLNPSPLSAGKREAKPLHFVAVGVFLLLAMLAKPVAVVTPAILAAIDLIFFQVPFRTVAARWAWSALLILPVLLIARSVQGDYPDVATPLWQRPFIAGDALAFYLVKIVWPLTLTHLYGRTPMRVIDSPMHYGVWLLPSVATLVLLGAARRKPLVLTGAAIILIGLLPVLGFTPFEFQIHSTVADHYLYLPMVGVAFAVAGVLNERIRSADRPSVALPICTLILVLLAFRSATQLRVWQDSISLDAHAVRVTPWSVDAHGSLGVALAEAGRVEDALPQFQFVAESLPQNWTAQVRLAQAYLALREFDRALPHAAAAVQLTRDRNIFPRLMLADALIGLNRRDEARQQLQIAGQISPNDPGVASRLEQVQAGSTTQP